MRLVSIGIIQMKWSENINDNIDKASYFVECAANDGAKIILLSELFEHHYFCKKLDAKLSDYGTSPENNKAISYFANVAKNLNVVMPISFCEKVSQVYFNSVAVVDADGQILGVYRKTHLPDGNGYFEKTYFSPGNDGFKVWDTKFAKIGVAVCWDQWFPEVARCMALSGAEILLYPTAIGSEPDEPDYDSKDHWQAVMCGHAAANMLPVVASNRVGPETCQDVQIEFYGSSFITDEKGKKVAEFDRFSEGYKVYEFDLEQIEERRRSWGLFRDRRPDLYSQILTLDGKI
jgi:N-carbamoylputrescine amidase